MTFPSSLTTSVFLKKRGNTYTQYKKSRKVACSFPGRSGEGLAKERDIVGVETLKEKEALRSYL
jgi:hypothetical protein